MATKTARRGLGRGLAALIPESDFDLLNTVARGDVVPLPVTPKSEPSRDGVPNPPQFENTAGDADTSPAPQESASSGAIRYLPIASIEANPFQPRQQFSEEELENLAASIREHGVLQPILVRPLPASDQTEKFQLIAGERRWRAATRAGLTQLPAIVRAVDDKSALELAIIENVQRHDISAIESAQAYKRLSKEFGLSGEQIASRVGKSRVSVSNTMRLLDLPEEAIAALREGKISEGHGRALLTATGDGARRALLRRALRDGVSVRELERLARAANASGANAPHDEETPAPRLSRAASADMARLETTLQRALGARLRLKARRRGGQIIIDFASPEELSRLVGRMTKPAPTERKLS
ncbi:MAG: ParB/RepB/Spo0J family partition protein [Armatimonadetes bacterium]|nr:ParB/RepB/Spo0J family partition protein [Armatimonadota bacterium]